VKGRGRGEEKKFRKWEWRPNYFPKDISIIVLENLEKHGEIDKRNELGGERLRISSIGLHWLCVEISQGCS